MMGGTWGNPVDFNAAARYQLGWIPKAQAVTFSNAQFTSEYSANTALVAPLKGQAPFCHVLDGSGPSWCGAASTCVGHAWSCSDNTAGDGSYMAQCCQGTCGFATCVQASSPPPPPMAPTFVGACTTRSCTLAYTMRK